MWCQIPIKMFFSLNAREGCKRTKPMAHSTRESRYSKRVTVVSYSYTVVHHNIATGGNYERSNLTSGRLVVAFSVATPIQFVRERYFGRPSCPKCGNLILAPEASESSGGCIRHRWPCDDCGYHFRSLVKVRI
jgi:ribosomal protein S27AE